MKLSRILPAILVIGTAFGATAQAETPWQAHHPWRAHDNARLENQNRRITAGVRDGQLTRGQAHALRGDDRAIRAEERSDSAVNGTHLTGSDQAAIRAQENANSAAVYQGRHP